MSKKPSGEKVKSTSSKRREHAKSYSSNMAATFGRNHNPFVSVPSWEQHKKETSGVSNWRERKPFTSLFEVAAISPAKGEHPQVAGQLVALTRKALMGVTVEAVAAQQAKARATQKYNRRFANN